MGPKIITKLQERRQIEDDLRELVAAGSEREFHLQAERIVSSGSQVIPALVGSLDQADAGLLLVLGTVATLLDRDEVTAALQRAAREAQRTDQGRLAALTILKRFLDVSLDAGLLAEVGGQDDSVSPSLEAVLAQAEGDPSILAGYVRELDQQEPDVVLSVVRALRDEVDQPAYELLRMIAQDVRGEIAAEALQALGAQLSPRATRALQALIPTTAPSLRPLAERLLRKLRFRGVGVEELPDPPSQWRALVSPVDGIGQQSVWFIQGEDQASHARFLNILLSDQVGAIEAAGHERVPALILPPRRPLGDVHDIAYPDGSGSRLMLEASFDLGRRMLLESLENSRDTQMPVAAELRLRSHWLWGVAGAGSLARRRLPELDARDEALLADTGRLLGHPAFSTWHAHSEAVVHAAGQASSRPGWDLEVWVKRLAGELFVGPAVADVFNRRLTAMSEWLLLAGDKVLSRLALVAAKVMLGPRPQDHPFVLAMIRRDLEQVVPEQQST